MNLNVSSPIYVKLGTMAFAVVLIFLSTLPAMVTVANWLADAGKVLFGIGLVSIQGNAASIAKDTAELKAKSGAGK